MKKNIFYPLTLVLIFAFVGCKVVNPTSSSFPSLFDKSAVLIETNPAGAKVYINEQYYGKAPVKVSLDPGAYLVKCEKKGFSTTTQWINVEKNKALKIKIELKS